MQTDDPKAVSQAEHLFSDWWRESVPLRLVKVIVVPRGGTGDDTLMGLGLSPTYTSSFRGPSITQIQPRASVRTTEKVIDWLVPTRNRRAFISFFSAYIAGLPAKSNRWELTQSDHFLRLNIGPLTCLDVAEGTIGMHVRPLSPELRRAVGRIGTVARGQKASKWFTPGALWIEIPIDRVGEYANKLLPEAAAFAQSVTRRTSWMYAHSASAVDYFARQSGRVLPDPRID